MANAKGALYSTLIQLSRELLCGFNGRVFVEILKGDEFG